MNRISIPKHEWDERLLQLLSSFEVYAPVENEFSCDYMLLDADIISEAVYNKPKPVTPLKKFFLPVKENVTSGTVPAKPVAIFGAPNCDVMGLALLDMIYMDEEYTDPAYQERRENTTVIVADCLSIQENCHCTSYGIEPTGNEHSDLALALVDEMVILTIYNKKGESAGSFKKGEVYMVELLVESDKEVPYGVIDEPLAAGYYAVHPTL